MKKLKWLILTLSILLLSGCGPSVSTYPSIELPYVIVDEEEILSSEYLDDDIEVDQEYLIEKQTLYSAITRDLTVDEAKRFVERNAAETTNVLMDQYKVVEFNFGDVNRLYNSKSFTNFPKSRTNFIYDEIIIPEFYQILIVENETNLTGTRYNFLKNEDENVVYASTYENMKILALVRNEYAQEGLQLKTAINDEEVYIDIEAQ